LKIKATPENLMLASGYWMLDEIKSEVRRQNAEGYDIKSEKRTQNAEVYDRTAEVKTQNEEVYSITLDTRPLTPRILDSSNP